MSYTFLEHTADVKFRAEAETLEEAFVSCSEALMETVCGEITILEQETKVIEVESNDLAGLLHDFLEEFLFILDSEGFLVSRVNSLEIDEDNLKLRAELIGDNARNYKFTNDVKAVTFNELEVKKEEDKFVCVVVLDV